jgi:DNA-binding protein
MSELPLAPLERILRNAGAKRVSEDAVVALDEMVENFAEELSEDAIAVSKHAGRATVTCEDVKQALSCKKQY